MVLSINSFLKELTFRYYVAIIKQTMQNDSFRKEVVYASKAEV